jgi:hypothetical protein
VTPDASSTSTSIVGLPRESRISRARIAVIVRFISVLPFPPVSAVDSIEAGNPARPIRIVPIRHAGNCAGRVPAVTVLEFEPGDRGTLG